MASRFLHLFAAHPTVYQIRHVGAQRFFLLRSTVLRVLPTKQSQLLAQKHLAKRGYAPDIQERSGMVIGGLLDLLNLFMHCNFFIISTMLASIPLQRQFFAYSSMNLFEQGLFQVGMENNVSLAHLVD